MNSLEQAIAQFENVNPSYNNPGGIEYGPLASDYGATAAPSGLAVFPNVAEGEAAFAAALQGHTGQTLQQLIDSWAPPGPSNPNDANYVNFVSQQTGISPNSNSFWSKLFSTLKMGTLGLPWGSLTGSSGGSGLEQVVAVILGLVLIAGGIFLFKPAQDIIIKTAKTAAEVGA